MKSKPNQHSNLRTVTHLHALCTTVLHRTAQSRSHYLPLRFHTNIISVGVCWRGGTKHTSHYCCVLIAQVNQVS